MENEIGRPLKVSELKERTIVILQKDDTAITIWVGAVYPQRVAFLAGEVRTTLILTRAGDDLDSLVDDAGTPIAVYEYLGKE